MTKSRDTRKEAKKKPAKTVQEKKKAKQEKKKNRSVQMVVSQHSDDTGD